MLPAADAHKSVASLEEVVTAKREDDGIPARSEQSKSIGIEAPVAAPTRAASRIEELRIMAEQARERLKELRKVNTEKAA
jgi:hypothetical protein